MTNHVSLDPLRKHHLARGMTAQSLCYKAPKGQWCPMSGTTWFQPTQSQNSDRDDGFISRMGAQIKQSQRGYARGNEVKAC